MRGFYPRSQSNDRDRYFRNYARSNGFSTRGNSLNGRQESQCSEESESGKLKIIIMIIILVFFLNLDCIKIIMLLVNIFDS